MSTITVESQTFSASEVRDAVNSALNNEREVARLRRDHFATLCRDFEETHHLTSDQFLQEFESGELGDDQVYFDWYAAKRGLDFWARRYQLLLEVAA